MNAVIAEPALVEDWRQEVNEHRGFFRTAGIVALIAGLLAILMTHIASLAASITLGALFLANGAISCVTAFGRREGHMVGGLLLGVLSVIAGGALLVDPRGCATEQRCSRPNALHDLDSPVLSAG